jgi:hypothetical protein
VLYYKYLMVLNGEDEYRLHFIETDALTDAQRQLRESAVRSVQDMVRGLERLKGAAGRCLGTAGIPPMFKPPDRSLSRRVPHQYLC